MGKINVLDIDTVNKIAAGEVVERPASAIKELIENAIDAGANSITVEIKNGGMTFMRVTDNGCGIPADEVEVAFLPHSTSKISSISDLEKLYTMGFRGEALASISSVSHVDILTKTKDEIFGTSMTLEGGKVVSKQEAGCPDGTTIVVRDLFFNTPARLNFMKKDSTEASHIADTVSRMIIGNPDISFRYISNGREVMFSSGNGDITEAYAVVYGAEFSRNCAMVNYNYEGIKVTGLAGLPHASRSNRNMQDFYVNGRWVKSKTIIHAAEQAYKTMLMVGKFPVLMLNIEIDAARTDVNVHPSKLEIKFSDENIIHSAVFWAVQNAILNADKIKSVEDKGIKAEVVSTYTEPVKPIVTKEQDTRTKEPENVSIKQDILDIFMKNETQTIKYEQGTFENVTSSSFEPIHSFSEPEEKSIDYLSVPENEETFSVQEQEVKPVKVIGQLFDTYIIAEQGDEMLLIDQHAAHERINYNNIVKDEIVKSQILMIPETFTLSALEFNTVFDNMDIFKNMGFEIEEFGNNTIVVRQAPDGVDVFNIKDTIIEITDIISGGGNVQEIYDKARFSVACKRAIKANFHLGEQEMVELANRAISDDNIRTCPHGRPVIISFDKKYIEKQFKRIV